jgi:(S)-sulfolactate dehydrogenase
MADIVISEFMDDAAVACLAARTPPPCARDLVDRPGDLRTAITDARVLIVGDHIRVDAALPCVRH